jgi:hypothetical protein
VKRGGGFGVAIPSVHVVKSLVADMSFSPPFVDGAPPFDLGSLYTHVVALAGESFEYREDGTDGV